MDNINSNKKLVIDKINKLEDDVGILKEMLAEIQSLIIIINKKIPNRTSGYIIGDYKTYDE